MATLLGFEQISYTRKSDNKFIEGTMLHIAEPFPTSKENAVGQKTENIWVGKSIALPNLYEGMRLKVFYNRYGSVEEVIED